MVQGDSHSPDFCGRRLKICDPHPPGSSSLLSGWGSTVFEGISGDRGLPRDPVRPFENREAGS